MMEQPREKALRYGIASLSNRELLAIIIRSGTPSSSALELADQVLHTKENLMQLMSLQLHDLTAISGIKESKALQILACLQLSQRISLENVEHTLNDTSDPIVLIDWLIKTIGYEEQEHFFVIFLDNRGKMISHKDMFIGTSNKSFANPREVFLTALQSGCNKIICTHNHPSGDVTPSGADLMSALALEESGDLLGIKVVDHIIVGKKGYYSFREHMQMLYQKQLLQQNVNDTIVKHRQTKAIFPNQ